MHSPFCVHSSATTGVNGSSRAKTKFDALIKMPMLELVNAFNEELAQFAPEYVTPPQKAVYRIYRDTRFAKDKTPYKTHVSAIFPRHTAVKREGSVFYFHFTEKELLFFGGVYSPEREELLQYRALLRDHHEEFQAILKDPKLKRTLGGLQGEQLSRMPKGFPVDHPAEELAAASPVVSGIDNGRKDPHRPQVGSGDGASLQIDGAVCGIPESAISAETKAEEDVQFFLNCRSAPNHLTTEDTEEHRGILRGPARYSRSLALSGGGPLFAIRFGLSSNSRQRNSFISVALCALWLYGLARAVHCTALNESPFIA